MVYVRDFYYHDALNTIEFTVFIDSRCMDSHQRISQFGWYIFLFSIKAFYQFDRFIIEKFQRAVNPLLEFHYVTNFRIYKNANLDLKSSFR